MTCADRYDALPKVKLHCHVEGSIRPALEREIAAITT